MNQNAYIYLKCLNKIIDNFRNRSKTSPHIVTYLDIILIIIIIFKSTFTFRFQEVSGLYQAKSRNKQEATPTNHRVPTEPSTNVSTHALHVRLAAKPVHAGTES